MSRRPKAVKSSRREFLKGAAVVGGAATLAVVAKGAVAKAPSPAEPVATPEAPKGYHVTPHIEQYYEKARF